MNLYDLDGPWLSFHSLSPSLSLFHLFHCLSFFPTLLCPNSARLAFCSLSRIPDVTNLQQMQRLEQWMLRTLHGFRECLKSLHPKRNLLNLTFATRANLRIWPKLDLKFWVGCRAAARAKILPPTQTWHGTPVHRTSTRFNTSKGPWMQLPSMSVSESIAFAQLDHKDGNSVSYVGGTYLALKSCRSRVAIWNAPKGTQTNSLAKPSYHAYFLLIFCWFLVCHWF